MSLLKLALVFLAAHLAGGLYFLFDRAPGTTAALVGLPLDDAWIHLVYARSLAALQGFAYNPGQLETGSTSPLWAILLVPATWLARAFGTSVVLPAKLTSLLAGAGASLAAAWAARALRLGLAVELAAGLAIASDPGLAFAQVSGMEVMLAAALALWAIAELAAERVWPAAIAAGMASLARPEMMLIALPVLALLEWSLHRRRASFRSRFLVLLPWLGCVGGWMIYCLAVSGYPLPSTFYVKFSGRPELWSRNLVLVLGQVLPAWPWFVRGAGFVLWGLGAVVLVRRGPAGMVAAGFPVAYLLAAAAEQSSLQAGPFYWQRYLLPALAVLLLGVAIGGVEVVRWAWRRRQEPWAPARACLAALVILASLAALPAAWRRAADRFAWNCQNIEELNVAMAIWLRDHVPAGETVAVTDAGAARYFARGPILDLLGLNHHRSLHGGGRAGGELDQVSVIVSFPSLVPFLRDHPAWQPVHRVATGHLTICDGPQSELVAYRRVGSSASDVRR